MDINAQFIQKTNNASLPIKEHMLLLDPQTKNTGIGGGEMTTWDIPTSDGANGQFLDMNSSYLEVKVRTTGATGAVSRLSLGGVNSLVATVDVESSNFVVEHTDNWGRLRQVLADVNDTDEDRSGYKAFIHGMSPDRDCSVSVLAADAAGTTAFTASGSAGLPKRQGAAQPAVSASPDADYVRYCIPIPSQQLNTGKHLPIHAISKLRYSITWVQAKDGLVASEASSAATGFMIDEPRLHLCYLEMSNKSRDVINSRSGLSWSHSLWETHKSNTIASTASQSFRVPSHKSSVKTLLATFHDPACSNSVAEDVDYNSRDDGKLASFQYRINGEYYPQNEVRTDFGGSEAVVELARAFHKVKGKTGQITKANYTVDDSTKAKSTFVLAMNTETNTGRSNSSFAGVSTLQESPLLLCKFGASNPAREVHMLVQYDGANTIKDGIWRVDN